MIKTSEDSKNSSDPLGYTFSFIADIIKVCIENWNF